MPKHKAAKGQSAADRLRDLEKEGPVAATTGGLQTKKVSTQPKPPTQQQKAGARARERQLAADTARLLREARAASRGTAKKTSSKAAATAAARARTLTAKVASGPSTRTLPSGRVVTTGTRKTGATVISVSDKPVESTRKDTGKPKKVERGGGTNRAASRRRASKKTRG